MINKYTYYMNNKLFKQALDVAEQEIYLKAYEATTNNQVVTAKLLGVSRGTLRERLKRWGIL